MVEDEAIIALDLHGLLTCAGYCVIGPVASVSEALPVLVNHKIDAAVLDIHLGKEMVYPVADKLISAQVPVVFVSGQPILTIPEHHRHRPLLRKPYYPHELLESLSKAMGTVIA